MNPRNAVLPVEYHDHLPEQFRAAAAHLYYSALQEKLAPILGSGQRAQSVLEGAIASDRCLVAVYNGALVGIMGIQTASGGFINPNLKQMVGIYGLLGGISRLVALAILHHKTRADEYYVDGVAVRGAMRGKGIGSHLFHLLEQKAMQNGIRMLSLEVIDTNPRARNLYERLGYVATLPQTLWPLNIFVRFPFSSSTRMLKLIG